MGDGCRFQPLIFQGVNYDHFQLDTVGIYQVGSNKFSDSLTFGTSAEP